MKIVAIALLFMAPAAAAEYSDLYVIPIAGHAEGAFGTAWRTDVVLHNVQQVPVTAEIVLVESGRSPDAAVVPVSAGADAAIHLMPGETRTLADLLDVFGRNVTGALIVGSDLPVAVSSRTYAISQSGRTLGQTVRPAAITGAADAVGDVAVLPALSAGEGRRSNVGLFIAVSRAPFQAEITIAGDSGAVLDSRVIAAGEVGFIHRQLPVATSGTAIVRIISGEGIVVPYASIIDNGSAEALFVSGEAIGAQAATAMRPADLFRAILWQQFR